MSGMSRGDEDAWEDLVRRLEEGETAPKGAGNALPDAGGRDQRSARPGGADGSGGDAPRAVAGFDFAVDPAVRAAAPGPRDWEAPAEDPFVTDFVPQEPEPVLSGRPDRVIAWVAAIGLPLFMLVLMMSVRTHVPPLLWPVMAVAALGAWVYLWWKMPREPRDPSDDGSRL